MYEELKAALEELDEQPDQQITELVQRIKRGALKSGATGPRHNLRQPLTTFFGREQELALLKEQLAADDTRIVTLLGPGGIGKTRLAVETGRQLAAHFRDGAYYVPVPEYRTAQGLAAGIAQALGFSSSRPRSSIDELADFLANKQTLLIIDAAEHAQDAASLLETLIGLPGVKLLVTSRVRLHLPGEYILEIQGLPYPQEQGNAHTPASVEQTPAYRLFVDRYSRLQPRFRPTDEDRAAIARVCRLVAGMPLAIEMAASWGRVLTCSEIAERIASFEPLAETLEERDQGMQGVFSFSWQMLTGAEQQAALRLSTFAGSFSRSAAEYVAECPASTIMALGDKSFLQWDVHGRFRIHEVIRGYLRRELARDRGAEAAAFQAHGDFFAGRLDSEPTKTIGQERVKELVDDLPNIQQAWRGWVSRMETRTLQRTLRSVLYLHELRDQWSAVVDLLEAALDAVRSRLESQNADAPAPADSGQFQHAQLLVLAAALVSHLGFVAMRLGDTMRAEAELAKGKDFLALLQSAGLDGESAAPGSDMDPGELALAYAHAAAFHRMVSGWLAFERGEAATGRAQLTAAAEELLALGDEWYWAAATSVLATLTRVSGDLERARQLYEKCLAVQQKLGDARAIAGTLLNLGGVYGNLQQYDEAERYFREARRYTEEGGHRLLQTFVIGNSAFLAYKRSMLAEAESLTLEALDLAIHLGHKSAQAQLYYYLALIALDRQAPLQALPYLRQALELSLSAKAVSLTYQSMHGYARYLHLTGKNEAAAALLYFVLNQPSYPKAPRSRSEEVLAAVTAQLSPQQRARAARKGAEWTLEAFVKELRGLRADR